MLAATLFTTLTAFGISAVAAPVNGPIPHNATLGRFPDETPADSGRGYPPNPPDDSGLSYWTPVDVDDALVGTIPRHDWQADDPFEDCHVIEWGGWNERYGEWGNDAKVVCRTWSKQVAWDIRRIGEVTNCRLNDQTETWKIERSETTKLGVDIGLSAAFKIFQPNIGLSASNELSSTSSYQKTVSCGDFSGVKCRVGGRALVELGYFEGWATIPEGDPVNTWNGQTHEWPYGLDQIREVTERGWNDRYESGWYDWETEGEQNCRWNYFDSHYHAVRL